VAQKLLEKQGIASRAGNTSLDRLSARRHKSLSHHARVLIAQRPEINRDQRGGARNAPSLARGLAMDPGRRHHEERASGSGLRQLREIGQRHLVRPVEVFNDEQSRLEAARPFSKPEERALLTRVNLASRLTDAAKAGEILISDRVIETLSGRLRVEAVGAVSVKGFDEPVRVWRLTGLGSPLPHHRPLVDRKIELRQFVAALQACRGDGDWPGGASARRGRHRQDALG